MKLKNRFRVDAFVEPHGIVAVSDARDLGGPMVRVEPNPNGVGWRERYEHERPLRWWEPLFARIVMTRRSVTEGEVMPPWWYAVGYVDFMRSESVFFFLPVAVLVRALRWVEFGWNRLRGRPSWFDKQLHEARWGRRGGA